MRKGGFENIITKRKINGKREERRKTKRKDQESSAGGTTEVYQMEKHQGSRHVKITATKAFQMMMNGGGFQKPPFLDSFWEVTATFLLSD